MSVLADTFNRDVHPNGEPMDPELQAIAANFTATLVRNTAAAIADKITALKQRGKADETINGLEELINALIADKAELARIATAYQDELVAQRISEDDIKYVTDTVVPLVKKLSLFGTTGSAQQTEQMLDALSALLSVETVSVLQILGFNFRQAIGLPLTQLVERAILSKSPAVGSSAEEITALELKRQNLLYQVSLDADATARLNRFLGRS